MAATEFSKPELIERLKAIIADLEKPEPKEATCEDYGEPLAVKNIPVSEFVRPPHATIGIIVDRHGNEQYSEIQAKRRVDCQNAMAGLSDPAAFVERAKKLEAWAKKCPLLLCPDNRSIGFEWTHTMELIPGWLRERVEILNA